MKLTTKRWAVVCTPFTTFDTNSIKKNCNFVNLVSHEFSSLKTINKNDCFSLGNLLEAALANLWLCFLSACDLWIYFQLVYVSNRVIVIAANVYLTLIEAMGECVGSTTFLCCRRPMHEAHTISEKPVRRRRSSGTHRHPRTCARIQTQTRSTPNRIHTKSMRFFWLALLAIASPAPRDCIREICPAQTQTAPCQCLWVCEWGELFHSQCNIYRRRQCAEKRNETTNAYEKSHVWRMPSIE